MKKIEMITVKEPTYPKKSSINKSVKNFYYEKRPIISNSLNIKEELEISEKKAIIDKNINKINDSVDKLLHQFSFLKLFNRAAKRNGTFSVKMMEFDKYFNKLKQEAKSIEKSNNTIKTTDELFDHSYRDLVYRISDVYTFISGLKEDLTSFENKYYPKMKVTAYNLCDGKSYEEIDALIMEVNTYINGFKSIEETFDYICYNSGVLITDTVDALVKSYNQSNYNISIKYFLKSEVVIAFSYFEWIDLMRKIKQTLFKYNKVKLSEEFNKLYHELELRYTIIIICNALMEV